ncbi:MAG: Fic family protein [SAR202 cluster bacterium]|mgnify:FL=1|jgi:Fic family protein|nr:hypothetical protein [Chloroflexota bacterium]MDP6663389.1 Fic family protein [SAR202 cluster bacterium]MQG67616.1 Fic family protein [SAR202 cluster bacterium]HAL49313.1 hypothetical protein [Dehalococcoidia bacterium]|tara:strand:+ start:57 stop:1226 length:1170 start_codon:yes stop_codon:yes gene_type:complete
MQGRQYRETHPWIAFSVDLRLAPFNLWMLLGEACSKCEHIAGVPIDPASADELNLFYLAKGARATTAIEGNTLSEEEVSGLVSGTLELPPSKAYLGREVNNIIEACNSVLADLTQGRTHRLTPDRIRVLNSKVLQGLELEEGVRGGLVRSHAVVVGRYRGAPAQDCEYLIGRLCDWLDEGDWPAERLGTMATAIVKAIVGHLYIAWIHPFGDGNGRTARLVEFQMLVEAGAPSPAAHLLSNHYNETRSEYYRQLDRARQTGNPVEFVGYALQGFVDGLRTQTRLIREFQLGSAWENHVNVAFAGSNSAADSRRRHLALDLSSVGRPVAPHELRTLTTRLAAAYAGKTPKTVTRDINALLTMGLAQRNGKRIVSNQRALLAFLPIKATPE